MCDKNLCEKTTFHVQINGGEEHTIEVKTSQYVLAALASLAILDFDHGEGCDVVKIWVPKLVEDGNGPYFYGWDGHQIIYPSDAQKW